mmetsp:Transcript_124195/g.218673  ORF Transcript_124195/g.218673 Transcript_124195/m.218673 type:complete len:206 (+) Transcript_124195:313-930(+)
MARSKCTSFFPHPFVAGWHLLFFITTADQFASTASGFWMSKHLPQPGLFQSLPQHGSSSPRKPASVSDAAPTSHIFSPYSAPPWSSGSCGPYAGEATKRTMSYGCMPDWSQLIPAQFQECLRCRLWPIQPLVTTPSKLNLPPTHSANLGGHVTFLYRTPSWVAADQPHLEKSLHPLANSAGKRSQRSRFPESAVLLKSSFHLPIK